MRTPGPTRPMARTVVALLIALISALVGTRPALAATTPPTPPTQPSSGPGGAAYPWSGSVARTQTFTDHTRDYWTYEPAGWVGAGSPPTTAPIVVFVHGWLGDDPKHYASWISHLVRKGNVVIFPRYQTSALTPPSTFTANAIFSIEHALGALATQATVKPNQAAGMALISHSYGGPVSANIANRWAVEGLPQPKAILFAEPYERTIDASLAGIPSTTRLDCIVGDVDTTTGRVGCDVLWDRTSHIPTTNRNYVWMFGDTHGQPVLTAEHSAPDERSGSNALDWYGFWKLGDALRDCGIVGTSCSVALGNTAAQRSLGTWSDGVPVRQMSVTTAKPPCPAGSGARGC